MFCPGWMFDVASARVAREYLAAEIPMETFGEKYAKYLSETYSDVSVDQLTGCAMAILEFLSEIEAGEMSVELIDHYCHDRLHFEKVGVPRRMKSMFGNVEDAVKSREYSQELLQKRDLCVPASERPNKHVAAGLASRGRRQYPKLCRGRQSGSFVPGQPLTACWLGQVRRIGTARRLTCSWPSSLPSSYQASHQCG